MEEREATEAGRALVFQFHYGSVKSRDGVNSFFDKIPFQFHYGSVKRNQLIKEICDTDMISIPLWFG